MATRTQDAASEEIERGSSLWRDAWLRMGKNKIAIVSLVVFIITCLLCFGFAWFCKDPIQQDLTNKFASPSGEHWLGTDAMGRDLFSRILYGGQISILVGLVATFVAVTIGVTYGAISGFYGGRADTIMMRIVDFFMVLPFLMIVIVFVTISPSYDIFTFSFMMAAFLWTGTARLVRSLAIQERELDYISASKTLGSSHGKIVFTQLMPNLVGIIIVNGTLSLAANIGIESGLSFIGFGFPEDYPSLGTLMAYATNSQTLQHRPWIWVPAAIMILVLMLCVRNIGEAMRRAGDARQRQA